MSQQKVFHEGRVRREVLLDQLTQQPLRGSSYDLQDS
jgi:hypothetical protein